MQQGRPIGEQTFGTNMTKALNYYRWIYRALEPAIGKRLLEIGVGSAPFVDAYPSLDMYFPADIDAAMVRSAERRWIGRDGDPGRVMGIVGDADQEDFWTAAGRLRPDSLIAVNVLEHIEDDGKFLAKARESLAPSAGKMALFVPALPAIYGTMDKAAGHYRRYTRQGLRDLAVKAGFKVQSLEYFNSLGAFLWFYQGRIVRTKDLTNQDLNRNILLYDRYAVPFIRVADRLLRHVFGQSLVLIARV